MNIKPEFNFEEFGIGVEDIKGEAARLVKQESEANEIPSVRTLEELLKLEGTEQPKLVEPILLQVGLAGIIGSSDTGKSCLARQLCLHVIDGKQEFLSFKLNPVYQQAIYVTTEDDESSTAFAYKRMLQENQCANPSGLRVIFEQENLLEQLDKLLTEQPADIIVIDAYLDIAPPDSNQATQTRKLLHQYRTLTNKHQTLILFVHHTGKAAKNLGPSKHGAVGSQSWEAKLRTVIELRSDIQNPNNKHLCVVKGNNISQEFKNSSFLLEFDESTLSFTDTGERVSFEDLKPDPEFSSGGNKGFRPEAVPISKHQEWLDSVFMKSDSLIYKELSAALQEASGRGRNAIEKGDGGLISYYVKSGLIIKENRGYKLPTPF